MASTTPSTSASVTSQTPSTTAPHLMDSTSTSQTPSTSASVTSQTPSTTAPHLMASTTSQTPLSSTSAPTSWDVFLSFRGVDTRYNFTSHLYSALDRYGVRTFMDDPELRTGEVISDALIKAIHESKTYVVVFSKNYASSSWCLDELVEILSCHKTMQRTVVPVFYNIEPSVARHQNGSFKEAFEVYETRFVGEREKVKKWRLALTEVANFSGKHISQYRSEADIINEIVDEIVLEINPNTLDVAKYPVGLDSRVKSITEMISSAAEEGVIKVGIYGMGGVGKTTLAKALFNQLLLRSFKGSCFLANAREISGTKGLVTLQEQLVNDVLKSTKKVEIHSVDQGTKLIGARICSTKILLVIDDLDDRKQFESLVGPFASGSVVILTTRDKEILDKIEVETRYRYRVNELDDTESLTLFSRHAFGNAEPNNTVVELCKDVLRHAGGLPLALEVFGSYLYKKSEVGWKSFIERLQRIPNSTIQQRLKISLDALESDNPTLKKIFLDISCVFIGMNKKRVVEIMKTYYSYADHDIDILEKKCLLTINHRDELRMHDLLQDMGREIARNNSPDEPGKHSRLWVPKEICDMLKKHEGTEAIEVIMPLHFDYEWRKISFAMESFRGMSKLRFLYLDGNNLTGNFGQTLEDLRWFHWNHCPLQCLPSEFYPKKLGILELRGSRLRTMWELNMVPHVFAKLKTLDMYCSKDLTTTPDFTRFPCLETLLLWGCKSLEEVHISIGSLVRLVSLDLGGCEKLRSLPDTICNLRALRSLYISDCSGLEALPIELGNIESLTELHASDINVSKLPDSLGRLTNLVTLDLADSNKLRSLPDTICNLRALRSLNISDCSGLEALPIELGNIESLTELHASEINVSKLPDSLGRLTNLVTLHLEDNKNLETLPDTICNLRALRSLNIDYCSGLEALPVELGNIESLTELHARRINVSKLPDSLGRLTNLVTLHLEYNKNLETLPDTICNLRSLIRLFISGCSGLEALPIELGNIESLKELHARRINVSKLPDSLGRLTNLVALHLEDNKNLETLPDISQLSGLGELVLYGCCGLLSIAELPPSLKRLNALGCKSIERLPNLSNLKQLEELVLYGCCGLLSIAELPPSLKRLDAYGCEAMERLPNLSNLKQLEELGLGYCSSLTEIRGLEELTSIGSLHFVGCDSSFLAYTFTELLFQKYSGFGHQICICIGFGDQIWFPDWISQSSDQHGFTTSLDLLPNVSHNYLGLILCFKIYDYVQDDYVIDYCIESSTSIFRGRRVSFGRERSDRLEFGESFMVTVPRSIFSVTDGDDKIKVTVDNIAYIVGIHLLYKQETTMSDEYDNIFRELQSVDP